jgi:hypothetical protein
VAKLNAIAVARITDDIPQNVNFAIKASVVTNLLNANSVKYQADPFQSDLSGPVPETQVSFAARTTLALANSPQATAKTRIEIACCRMMKVPTAE